MIVLIWQPLSWWFQNYRDNIQQFEKFLVNFHKFVVLLSAHRFSVNLPYIRSATSSVQTSKLNRQTESNKCQHFITDFLFLTLQTDIKTHNDDILLQEIFGPKHIPRSSMNYSRYMKSKRQRNNGIAPRLLLNSSWARMPPFQEAPMISFSKLKPSKWSRALAICIWIKAAFFFLRQFYLIAITVLNFPAFLSYFFFFGQS